MPNKEHQVTLVVNVACGIHCQYLFDVDTLSRGAEKIIQTQKTIAFFENGNDQKLLLDIMYYYHMEIVNNVALNEKIFFLKNNT